jgi:hypothetical protein
LYAYLFKTVEKILSWHPTYQQLGQENNYNLHLKAELPHSKKYNSNTQGLADYIGIYWSSPINHATYRYYSKKTYEKMLYVNYEMKNGGLRGELAREFKKRYVS